MQRCLDLPRYTEGLARSIVVVSDGYVSVEDEAFELVRNNLNQANLFSFGIGSSVNRHLMEGLARAGQGAPFIVTDPTEAAEQAEKLRRYIQQPLFTQITPYFTGDIIVYDLEPSSVPDVLSDRPVILMGKLTGELKGSIDLEGYVMEPAKQSLLQKIKGEHPPAVVKKTRLSFNLDQAQSSERYAAIRYLWAREKIRNLSDFTMGSISEANRLETTRLGLQYNLLTNFTSFIAVEKVIVNENPAEQEQVNQPLPMPAGVSNEAIGFELSLRGISGLAGPVGETQTISWHGILAALFSLLLIGFWAFKYMRSTLTILLLGIFTSLFYSCGSMPEAAPQPHDAITFILGEDQSSRNPYYATALKYFSTDSMESTPLIVNTCHNLLAVRQYLLDHAPDQDSWKRINLVVHGNEWTGINVPIIGEEGRCSQQELLAAQESGHFLPLPDEVIDEHTTLAVFGCNVGKDTALLQQLSVAFGGTDAQRPKVSSARYFNIFRDEGLQFGRHLAKSHFVAIPAGKFPGNRYLAQQFAEKYSQDTINWMQALLTLEPQGSEQPYVHYFNIPAEWTVVYPSGDIPKISEATTLNWINEQKDLQQELGRLQLPSSAFRWEIEQTQVQGYPALQAQGQKSIYCSVQPRTDDDESFLQPAIEDQNYYAVVRKGWMVE